MCLRRSKARIQAVATGMAGGYITAVFESLAKTDLVLDHFSIVNCLISFASEFCSELPHTFGQLLDKLRLFLCAIVSFGGINIEVKKFNTIDNPQLPRSHSHGLRCSSARKIEKCVAR